MRVPAVKQKRIAAEDVLLLSLPPDVGTVCVCVFASSLPSCLWSLRIFPSLPGSRLTFCLSRCKFSTLTTRQPIVEFYVLTFPRFPLRKKEHKSYFGKNRTHDFRTSRCAGYLLDHSGDETPVCDNKFPSPSRCFSLLLAVSSRVYLFFPPRGHEPPPTLRDRLNPHLSH